MRKLNIMPGALLGIALSAAIPAGAQYSEQPWFDDVHPTHIRSVQDPVVRDPGNPATEKLPELALDERLRLEKAADDVAAEAAAEVQRHRYSSGAKLVRARVSQAMDLGQTRYLYYIRELNEQLERRNVLASLGLRQRPHGAITPQQFDAERVLYGNRTVPPAILSMIRREAIEQGKLRDCWFLSTLAVIANEYPYLIPAMITVNEDGSYTVKFPGNPAHPVRVASLPQFSEKAVRQTEYGRWTEVLERAAYQLYPRDIIEGGHDALTLRLLTGADATQFCLAPVRNQPHLSAEGLGQIVVKALDTNQPIILSTNDNDGVGPNQPGPLEPTHSYTVVGYVPANAQHGAQVVLRNPWVNPGVNSGDLPGLTVEPNGRVTMPVTTAHRYFGWLTVASRAVGPANTQTAANVSPPAPAAVTPPTVPADTTNNLVNRNLPAVPQGYINPGGTRMLPSIPHSHIRPRGRQW
jgi:hypothetical protein